MELYVPTPQPQPQPKSQYANITRRERTPPPNVNKITTEKIASLGDEIGEGTERADVSATDESRKDAEECGASKEGRDTEIIEEGGTTNTGMKIVEESGITKAEVTSEGTLRKDLVDSPGKGPECVGETKLPYENDKSPNKSADRAGEDTKFTDKCDSEINLANSDKTTPRKVSDDMYEVTECCVTESTTTTPVKRSPWKVTEAGDNGTPHADGGKSSEKKMKWSPDASEGSSSDVTTEDTQQQAAATRKGAGGRRRVTRSNKEASNYVYNEAGYYYLCEMCDASFTSKSELSEHMFLHRLKFRSRRGEKRGLPAAEDMDSKRAKVDSGDGAKVEVPTCAECQCTFPTITDYQEHVEIAHSKPSSGTQRNEVYRCNYCDKNYRRMRELKRHLKRDCVSVPRAVRNQVSVNDVDRIHYTTVTLDFDDTPDPAAKANRSRGPIMCKFCSAITKREAEMKRHIWKFCPKVPHGVVKRFMEGTSLEDLGFTFLSKDEFPDAVTREEMQDAAVARTVTPTPTEPDDVTSATDESTDKRTSEYPETKHSSPTHTHGQGNAADTNTGGILSVRRDLFEEYSDTESLPDLTKESMNTKQTHRVESEETATKIQDHGMKRSEQTQRDDAACLRKDVKASHSSRPSSEETKQRDSAAESDQTAKSTDEENQSSSVWKTQEQTYKHTHQQQQQQQQQHHQCTNSVLRERDGTTTTTTTTTERSTNKPQHNTTTQDYVNKSSAASQNTHNNNKERSYKSILKKTKQEHSQAYSARDQCVGIDREPVKAQRETNPNTHTPGEVTKQNKPGSTQTGGTTTTTTTMTTTNTLAQPVMQIPAVNPVASVSKAKRPLVCGYCGIWYFREMAIMKHMKERCIKIPAMEKELLRANNTICNATQRPGQQGGGDTDSGAVYKMVKVPEHLQNTPVPMPKDVSNEDIKELNSKIKVYGETQSDKRNETTTTATTATTITTTATTTTTTTTTTTPTLSPHTISPSVSPQTITPPTLSPSSTTSSPSPSPAKRGSKCRRCHEQFESKEAVLAHSSVHHGPKKGLYRCKLCNARIGKYKNLREHVWEHTNESPYRCHLCGAHYRNSDLIVGHLLNVHQYTSIHDKNLYKWLPGRYGRYREIKAKAEDYEEKLDCADTSLESVAEVLMITDMDICADTHKSQDNTPAGDGLNAGTENVGAGKARDVKTTGVTDTGDKRAGVTSAGTSSAGDGTTTTPAATKVRKGARGRPRKTTTTTTATLATTTTTTTTTLAATTTTTQTQTTGKRKYKRKSERNQDGGNADAGVRKAERKQQREEGNTNAGRKTHKQNTGESTDRKKTYGAKKHERHNTEPTRKAEQNQGSVETERETDRRNQEAEREGRTGDQIAGTKYKTYAGSKEDAVGGGGGGMSDDSNDDLIPSVDNLDSIIETVQLTDKDLVAS